MIQTAFPFGYLIQFVLFVVGVVAAVVMISAGLKRGRKLLFRAGLVTAAMIAMVIGLAMAQPHVDDWDPGAPREAYYGRWVDGEERSLELRADSTYTLREGSEVTEGRYDLEDGNWGFRLMSPAGVPLPTPPSVLGLRLVEVDGEYRIINDPYEPDVWDGWLGYRRDPPAKVP
jgi:hypothetical protein